MALLLGMPGLAGAESALRWDAKLVELHPGSQEKTARGEFVFTNRSKQPVTIDSVRSSCGCTTAVLDKKTYAPGEKGRIAVTFTIGSRQGVQVKAIRVNVHGEPEPALLTLVTQIGETVQIEPSLVYWRKGDAPQPKTIKLKIPAGMGLRPSKVTSSNARIAAVLEMIRDGAEYKITVTPEETAREAIAVLTIQAVSRQNEPKVFQAYAQIRGAAVR